MIAHLYKIPSTFRNVPDAVKIREKPYENFPGTWLHANLHLPDGLRVADSEYGEGAFITEAGEGIFEAYADPEQISGNDLQGRVTVRDSAGKYLIDTVVIWN